MLPHFEDEKAYVFDINLSVKLIEDDGTETSLARTNAKELYYSPVQQVLHHSSSGSGMSVGDLLGSGTISGIEKRSRAARKMIHCTKLLGIVLGPIEARKVLDRSQALKHLLLLYG